MIKSTITYLLLGLTSLSFAQTLTGTLLSQDTKESIPFATVRITKNYGVITNTEGNFSIVVNQFTTKDSIEFSSMGFKTKRIAIGDFKNNQKVILETAVNELGEVFLKDQSLTGRELIDKFLKNKNKNYATKANSYNIFIRNKYQSTYKDYGFELKKANYLSKKIENNINKELEALSKSVIGETSTYFTEKLVDFNYLNQDSVHLKPYRAIELSSSTSNNDVEEIQNRAFKKIFEKLENSNSFKVRTFIIRVADSLDLSGINEQLKDQPDTLDVKSVSRNIKGTLNRYTFTNTLFEPLAEPDDYAFEIDDVTSFNNQMVYVVNYAPDRNRAKYIGKFYITAKDFAIVKLTQRLAEGKSESKLNLKFLFGIKFDAYLNTKEVTYFKTENGTYYPKYIKSINKQYFYLDRKFVFKENNDDRSERLKFKLEILAEADNTNETELFVVNQRKLSVEDYSLLKEAKPMIIEQFKNYSPEIWKDQNVLEATKEIKTY
ncbi:CarboxypepD_reg-like domain-containing protein [Psychroflexus salarius]|uniref:CarboxypepD_reg-like domain-containing protein n=1 Tax=Psychroflexus salarius TaxID=1155689 RepID=A0A1M4XZ77_9FLAO|nr:carboxypeptidase-like regulatory domain-containing protein [Psychroflexus salarius]SHE98745.1 CarboxypepD_reg-like domain-containing protein [Psychroflexus salarius]